MALHVAEALEHSGTLRPGSFPPTRADSLNTTGTDPALANDLAWIVGEVFVSGEYVPLNVRYGIAHAVLRAGYTKPAGC